MFYPLAMEIRSAALFSVRYDIQASEVYAPTNGENNTIQYRNGKGIMKAYKNIFNHPLYNGHTQKAS